MRQLFKQSLAAFEAAVLVIKRFSAFNPRPNVDFWRPSAEIRSRQIPLDLFLNQSCRLHCPDWTPKPVTSCLLQGQQFLSTMLLSEVMGSENLRKSPV